MKRIKYETIKPISPELPFVLHHVDRRPLVYKGTKIYNWHNNLELIYCTHGMVKTFCDETEYMLKKGDMLVVNPDCFHGTFEYDDSEYYVLMIDPDFSHSNGIYPENNRLTEYISNPDTAKLFDDIIESFKSTSELRIPIIRKSVLNLLVHLYSNHSQGKAPKSYIVGKNRINDVIRFINEHFREKLTIDLIAKHIGISKSYLSHEFTKFTGHTLIEYINLLKCNQAQKFIRSGMNVSESATELGFENLSYFTKTYKKYLNRLPSDDFKNKE